MITITAARIRSAIAGCMTEKDVELSLRRHKIKYSYSTDTGYMSLRVPCRKGAFRIYRSASRSAPFIVKFSAPRDSLRMWPAYY